MKRIICTLLTGIFCCVYTHAVQRIKYDSFEDGVPKHWHLKGKGKLSTSPWHYKHGKKSLQWDFAPGDVITVSNKIGNTKRCDPKNGSTRPAFCIWVYVENPMKDKFLRFEFREGEKTVDSFDCYLNFKGWQDAFVMYYQRLKHVSEKTDRVVIKAPKDAKGRVFIDLVIYNGLLSAMNTHIPPKAPWCPPVLDQKLYPLPTSVSEADKISIKKLEEFLPKCGKGNRAWCAKVIERLKSWNVVQDSQGIRGVPVQSPYKLDPLSTLFLTENGIPKSETRNFYEDLYRSMRQYKGFFTLFVDPRFNAKERDEMAPYMVAFFKHFVDQGFNTSASYPLDYPYHKIPFVSTVYFFRKAIQKDPELTKELGDYIQYEWGMFAPERKAPHMDYFFASLLFYMQALTRFSDIHKQIQAFRYISAKLSKEIIHDSCVYNFKTDGSTHHHRMHLFGYMQNAIGTLAKIFYGCKGSSFQLSAMAYKRIKTAALNACFYSNNATLPLAAQGRYVFRNRREQINTLIKSLKLLALASPAGEIDKELSQAYVNINPVDTEFARKYNIKHKVLEGNLSMPYAGYEIQRRKGWLAFAAGHGKYLMMGTEIFHNMNRYGRFIPEASLDIIGKDGFFASGNQSDGWDWRRINGATVILWPLAKVQPKEKKRMIFHNPYPFYGGISWFGKNGCFTMKLGGGHTPVRGKKSYFFIEDRVYAVGSGIKSKDRDYPVQTNLFQKHLAAKSAPTYVNGKKITAFPVKDKALDAGKNHYLLDVVGNGYYIPKNQKVFYARKSQKSRDHFDRKAATGDFATAWIDHGKAPKKISYEYAVLPYCGEEKLAAFAKKAAAGKAYKILQNNKRAHIIHDLIDDFYAGIFFKKQLVKNMPLIANVERACMIMYKKTPAGLKIAVGDPDLHIKKITNWEHQSILTPLKVTLSGAWKLAKETKGVKIAGSDKKNTIIEIACIKGKTFDFILTE